MNQDILEPVEVALPAGFALPPGAGFDILKALGARCLNFVEREPGELTTGRRREFRKDAQPKLLSIIADVNQRGHREPLRTICERAKNAFYAADRNAFNAAVVELHEALGTEPAPLESVPGLDKGQIESEGVPAEALPGYGQGVITFSSVTLADARTLQGDE